MDIEMESKLAGLYATREILKFVPQCKVIIYTCHSDGYYITKAFQFGAVDYLVKPTADYDLVDTILLAAENRCWIHPQAAAHLRTKYAQLENAQESLNYIIHVILLLTPTELEILKMMHTGMKQQEIAKVRFIEMTTMKTHISNILKKFDRRTMAEVLQTVDSVGFFEMLDQAD